MKTTKKFIAFFITIILVMGIIPLTVTKSQAETIKLGYIFETYVNIRKDATTTSEKVAQVSEWNVTVLGSKKDTTGAVNPKTNKTYVWYKISYPSSSKTIEGYVREDLINVTEYTVDEAFKKSLEAFPESYRDALMTLHSMYPNWKFEADEVGRSFNSAVDSQDNEYTKLVSTKYNSWRSMRNKCYDWSTGKFITTDGGRYGASREVIAYYMDPRNFLNANDIYIYMKQSYDSTTQTVEGIQKLLKGTFLEGKVTDKKDKYYGKPYAGVIRYAGSKSGVNAYVLASTIIQEHGTKGSTLSKGTTYKEKTVYNFFNFGASGTTADDVLKNGKKYAYKEEWFTPTKSIVGGATKYGENYINSEQDHYQNTYFYKNYNVLTPERTWHQYAQNVSDSLSSSRKLKTTYAEMYDMALTFRIPVFTSLPSSVSKLPKESDKLNNYYFDDIKVEGLSPAYNRYELRYTLAVSGNTTITCKLPEGTTYTGETSYKLLEGKNTVKLKIKSQTGYPRTYTITVTAEKEATLKVNPIVAPNSNATLTKEADGNWYYYVDGEKTVATTLVKYSGKWFYVKDGVWDKKATTLVKYSGKWFYIENGKWNSEAKTLIKYNGVWFYIKNGKWDNTAKTLVKYSGQWFYVKGGKWAKDTLIFTYNGKQFYVKSGKVDLTFSGKVKLAGESYKIKNGKVV